MIKSNYKKVLFNDAKMSVIALVNIEIPIMI